MFDKQIYIARRAALIERMACSGVVVIAGGELSPNSYPSNAYYFRQDATFRYLFGVDQPSLWGVVDLDSRVSMLFGRDTSLADIIWTGELPSIWELGERVGVDTACSTDELEGYISKARGAGRRIHILPPYRGETKIALAELLDIKISQLQDELSPELIFAVAELRECKGAEEIAELEEAYNIGFEMHTTAMRMCRAGVVEREIGGRLEGIARAMGGGVSFPPICTQHGEILHNIEREGVLTDGRLMLCDAGGESLSGYCSDHTRTYPVSGRFTDVQRDIYNIVLRAHHHIRTIARPNILYRDLHQEAYRILGEGLRDLGFLRGSMDEIIESEVLTLFMPHGLGHGLGLDVHDCEAFGERSFDVARYSEFAERSTSCIIRSSWILREGTVLTNEPGIYFIPELIRRHREEGRNASIVDYDRVERYLDFGGIRIEDDLVITKSGCHEIGSDRPANQRIPVEVDEIENFLAQNR